MPRMPALAASAIAVGATSAAAAMLPAPAVASPAARRKNIHGISPTFPRHTPTAACASRSSVPLRCACVNSRLTPVKVKNKSTGNPATTRRRPRNARGLRSWPTAAAKPMTLLLRSSGFGKSRGEINATDEGNAIPPANLGCTRLVQERRMTMRREQGYPGEGHRIVPASTLPIGMRRIHQIELRRARDGPKNEEVVCHRSEKINPNATIHNACRKPSGKHQASGTRKTPR